MSEITNDNSGSVAAEATTTNTPVASSEAPQQAAGAADGTSSSASNLILGKFKSQDELANSYKELETKLASHSQLQAKAERLEKLAKASGTSVEDLERQIDEEAEKAEMKASGVNDPAMYRMQKRLEELETANKQSAFEAEFSALKQQYPVLERVKDGIKSTFLSSKGKTLTQIANELYIPVIAEVEQSAVARLGEKEAANALAPRGNVQYAVTEQELSRLKKAARSGSASAIAAYMVAKRASKK